MLNFLLQCGGFLEMEALMLKEQLKSDKFLFSFKELTIEQLKSDSLDENIIPVGDIDFVSTYMKKMYGIINEKPIEIPKYLRTDEFLKRDYKICTWDNIPKSGCFFLKDVSQLKKFSIIINATYMNMDDMFNYVPETEFDNTIVLDKTNLFQVSSIVSIIAEYRVYVLGGAIKQMSCYAGNCTKFPDIRLINKAVNLINYHEKYLRSYTLDVAVTNAGTCILEVHNFTSVGLYSTQWDSDLPYAYRDGIDYLIYDNHKLEL